MKTKNYAFVDGSYNPNTKTYGCGVILVDNFRRRHELMRSGRNVDMCLMRNVGGEILGVIESIKLAKHLHMKSLTIYHDYEGLSKWPSGEWTAKKRQTQKYSKFVQDAIDKGLKISFCRVKAHSGVRENEEADRLAKQAVGLL